MTKINDILYDPITSYSLLEKAIILATRIHTNQKDKGGEHYIFHPLRVMLSVDSLDAKIVAVLHDVIEDSTFGTLDDLSSHFGPDIVDALDHLTRRKGEKYERFIMRCAGHPLALVVKIADLKDNMNLSRIPNPTEKDIERTKKYQAALQYLEYQLL